MNSTGSVSWAGAQPFVLGKCGGGGVVPYPSSSCASAQERGGGGGGRFRSVGVVRCCAQEKKPPRVRKTKEERREMVESFVNTYRISNDGKFPSVNLTHKEVGGSYYIVREIVRDIIQENRVLGPGGLNAKALSFEDCPDSFELSIRQELDQNDVEILDKSDGNQAEKDSILEVSKSEEVVSSQKNVINTQQLVESSYLLEASVLNGAVQNGERDEVPYGELREFHMNSSEKQGSSIAHAADSDKEIELDSLEDGKEGTSSSVTDEVILFTEPSAAFQTNGALLEEHVTSPNHNDITHSDVLQINKTLSEQDVILPENVCHDGVPVIDRQISSTVDAFDSITSYKETEDTTNSIGLSEVQRAQEEFEQSMLDASPDEHEKLEDLVSQELVTKGLLHMKDKHMAKEGESEFSKSISTATKEECEASDAKNEHGISTTTAISRRTGKAQTKKETNLFWLIIRAFVVAMSKFWKK